MEIKNGFVDSLRFTLGGGYMRSQRLRLELLYVPQLSRQAAAEPLSLTSHVVGPFTCCLSFPSLSPALHPD
jgi:hypothetical protein